MDKIHVPITTTITAIYTILLHELHYKPQNTDYY